MSRPKLYIKSLVDLAPDAPTPTVFFLSRSGPDFYSHDDPGIELTEGEALILADRMNYTVVTLVPGGFSPIYSEERPVDTHGRLNPDEGSDINQTK